MVANNLPKEEPFDEQGWPRGEQPEEPQPTRLLEEDLEQYSQAEAAIFRVPGFQSLKESYISKFRERVKRGIDEFNSLQSIPPQEKERILPQMRHSIARIFSYETWWDLEEEINNTFIWIWFIGTFALIAGGLIWLRSQHPLTVWWVGLILGLIISIAFAAIVLGEKYSALFLTSLLASLISALWLQVYQNILSDIPGDFMGAVKISLELSMFVFFFSVLILYLGLALYLADQSTTFPIIGFLTVSCIGLYWFFPAYIPLFSTILKNALIAGLIAGVISCLLIFMSIIPGLLLHEYIKRVKTRKYAEDEIAESLYESLYLIESNPDRWKETAFRAEVVRSLDWVEKRIQKDLYSSLAIDPAAKAWLLNCTNEMAADLARMAQGLILPKEETRNEMIKNLAGKLINAADRNWGKFERVQLTSSLPWWSKVLISLRSALFISLPFLIIIGVEFFPLNLDEPTKNSITTAAIGFGVLNLLSWLDPQYAQKIDILKKYTSQK